MIILDTNVVSEPLRPKPDPTVTAWLDAQAPQTLFLTTLTLAEVRFGIAVLPDGKRREALHRGFEDDVIPLFAGRVLPFDEPASTAYARIRATARDSGSTLSVVDALIAGIAASRGFAVATRDTRPFRAAGVATLNPFDEA